MRAVVGAHLRLGGEVGQRMPRAVPVGEGRVAASVDCGVSGRVSVARVLRRGCQRWLIRLSGSDPISDGLEWSDGRSEWRWGGQWFDGKPRLIWDSLGSGQRVVTTLERV